MEKSVRSLTAEIIRHGPTVLNLRAAHKEASEDLQRKSEALQALREERDSTNELIAALEVKLAAMEQQGRPGISSLAQQQQKQAPTVSGSEPHPPARRLRDGTPSSQQPQHHRPQQAVSSGASKGPVCGAACCCGAADVAVFALRRSSSSGIGGGGT